MNLFRGLADDLPLMDWLKQHIWPAEIRHVSAEMVGDGVRLAVAEMVRSGTTCFSDMYFFPDETAQVASDAGMRVCIGLILIDAATVWAKSIDEYFYKGEEVHDRFRNHSHVTTAFAPHAPYSVSDATLERVAILAEELDIPICMHVHETTDEIEQSLAQHQVRPLERLDRLGLVSPRLNAVHMTQINNHEIKLLHERNVHVIHCPQSNLKLASGLCPAAKLVASGVNVVLGTDGAASNNDLDMWDEMRCAALLAKGISGDASALPAGKMLRMATLDGARALGLDDCIGSLEVGKEADIIAVDLGAIETQPVYNPVSQLVYAAGREQVSHVWVAGKPLLHDRVLTRLDEQSILTRTRKWRDRISG